MTEWIFGAPPISYFTATWEIALPLAAVFLVSGPPARRAAFVVLGALVCYGLYLVALWIAFQVPFCEFPDRSGDPGTVLANTRNWYMCGVIRAAWLAAACSAAGLFWLVREFRRR